MRLLLGAVGGLGARLIRLPSAASGIRVTKARAELCLLLVGAGCGIASLQIYRSDGYARGMGWLWLASLVALSAAAWSRSRALPKIATGDLVAPVGLALVFAPLYLLSLYRNPVQVSSDEVAIIDTARFYAHAQAVDPFGVSNYLSRPTLLFIGWGRLGELLGGTDLHHMRLLHALCGLAVLVASYALFRQLLPRGWSLFATGILGASHALFMISRLAMRENTSVLIEVVALALLLWGLRNDHLLATFWGGVIAGLGFYVYFPARATLPIWIVFLVLVGLLFRQSFPLRKLAFIGSVALAGFVLMAAPIMSAEAKIPIPVGGAPSDYAPQRQTLLIYPEGRIQQQRWVNAKTIAEGVWINVKWGLTAFNNTVIDHGFIYINPGHGFVDPLTGILLWLGVGLLAIRITRRRADEGDLLVLTGFVALWLSFAFVVNKAPNYTRLLITLPFVALLVTVAVRWLASRWREIRHAQLAIPALALTALVVWNLAIGWDFIKTGRRTGDPIGSTGRYAASHRDIPDERFYVATSVSSPYHDNWSNVAAALSRIQLFAKDDAQVAAPVDPYQVKQFRATPPFALFMRREVWQPAAADLANVYPTGRIRDITPDGQRVVLEVPRS